MAKFIAIYVQIDAKTPAQMVGRKEVRVARAMMNQARVDFAEQGMALRLDTPNRIVTETGAAIYFEKA